MLYAQVVLGLPAEGPFDYIVPQALSKKIKPGIRVWVPFGTRRMLGYVVKLALKTKIKNLKNILGAVDETPLLDRDMLSLAKRVADYYCCSWGEAIATALPDALRKGKPIAFAPKIAQTQIHNGTETILVHDLGGKARWDIYFDRIKEALDSSKSILVLSHNKDSMLRIKEIISLKFNLCPEVLYRQQPKELGQWLDIKNGKARIVIGARSSIFAPVSNLGLIIVDEEEDTVYKQEQAPHYNARRVAFMRADLEKAKLVLGSGQPSLENLYLARLNKIKYIFIPRKDNLPEIKIIDAKNLGITDARNNLILSKYIQDSIAATLNSAGKTLLFLNRRGFATLASCRHCGTVLKCQRCNVNLVFHFKDNILSCRYCNFKMEPPSICPNCNSSYIRYSGAGTEKIESELSRLFPSARIRRLDNQKCMEIKDADIFVSTESILGRLSDTFGLVAVLGIDNSLNRVDFRASEKTFGLLAGLLRYATKKFIIQTSLPNHHCFRALEDKDINIFYDEELRQRKELKFPPYRHLGLVKLRGKKEDRVNQVSNDLFNRLNKNNKNKSIRIISVNPGHPSKLRGNFYWQILISSDSAEKISRFLKMHLKKFPHSGIIVTVDIDPL